MISYPEIRGAFIKLSSSTTGAHGSAVILKWAAQLRDYAEKLVDERDALAERNRILEQSTTTKAMLDEVKKLYENEMARAEAYREVARNIGHVCHRIDCRCGIEIDDEAAKLLAQRVDEMKNVCPSGYPLKNGKCDGCECGSL